MAKQSPYRRGFGRPQPAARLKSFALGRLGLTSSIVLFARGLAERLHVLLEPSRAHERRRGAVIFDEVESERNGRRRRQPKQDRASGLSGFQLDPPSRLQRTADGGRDFDVGPT